MTDQRSSEKKSSFIHPFVTVEYFNRKYYKVSAIQPPTGSSEVQKLSHEEYDKFLNKVLDPITEELPANSNGKYYYLSRDEYGDFIELIEKFDRKQNNEESESESESSHSTTDESSTDDELIQKTLTRRLTRGSQGYENDQDHVSDSELEDVISLCRRFRSVYTLVKNMAKRIERLEDTLFKNDSQTKK
jgi:hypothetical protein